jgi:DNA sulfur modification protein DndB
MSNKTFIPAFQCSVGDWKYYICMMKYGEVARQVQFSFELSGNAELDELVQRGISPRTAGITEYLLSSTHRFLGGIVVAAWGGEPQYTPLAMDDPDGILRGIDREFGVLTFDGTQAYFVLDGQHRLRAIKDALKKDPDLGKEDLCVLIVTHYDSPEGRLRTRRLFSNINRNAKQTGTAENIALDEDDSFAILTRQLLIDHEFFNQEGRIRVILSRGQEGELKLASSNIPKTDTKAFTTFTVLYDMLKLLSFGLPEALHKVSVRPPDDVLRDSYSTLITRLDLLLNSCGNIRQLLEDATSARDIRAPKTSEGEGHPFMRPIVQKTVSRVARDIVNQEYLDWETVCTRLSELDWKMASSPFESVFDVNGGKMLAGKDNAELLYELLYVHIAPQSKQAIIRARKNYKNIRGKTYSFTEEDLALRLPVASVSADASEIKSDVQ